MPTIRSTDLTLGALLTGLRQAGDDRLRDETVGGEHWAVFRDWCHARGIDGDLDSLTEWCAVTEAALTGDDYAALRRLAQQAQA